VFPTILRSADPDEPLVAAARKGDINAFDVLVRRYQGRLTLFVRSRLDSAIDPEDVAQDIFVTAWCHLGKFGGRSRFKTWLFGIAMNLCAEAARRHRNSRAVVLDLEPDGGSAGDMEGPIDPVDWPSVLVEREDIRQRLEALSGPEREVLELYYYAELNLPEIAQLLDVNLSTLKYRFYQAHRRLRKNFETHEAVAPGANGAPSLGAISLATGRGS
jgi:RNA polymerase sigma-70 factor (ECF subfamily)